MRPDDVRPFDMSTSTTRARERIARSRDEPITDDGAADARPAAHGPAAGVAAGARDEPVTDNGAAGARARAEHLAPPLGLRG